MVARPDLYYNSSCTVLDYRNMSAPGKNYFVSEDGRVRVESVPSVVFGQKFEEIEKALKEYKWREDDVLLASFPKNGNSLIFKCNLDDKSLSNW